MEPTHKDLLQQIAGLSETYPNLADRLAQSAKQLQDSGLPPSESLLQEIVSYSRNFSLVQKQALELSNSALVPGEVTSLKEIQDLNAFMSLQLAAMSGGVKQESRELKESQYCADVVSEALN